MKKKYLNSYHKWLKLYKEKNFSIEELAKKYKVSYRDVCNTILNSSSVEKRGCEYLKDINYLVKGKAMCGKVYKDNNIWWFEPDLDDDIIPAGFPSKEDLEKYISLISDGEK